MFAAYLVAAIVGGVLVGATVLGGGHTDAGAPALEGGAPGDLHGGAHATDGDGPSVGGVVLSLRFWSYLLAFGGVTGLLLRTLARTGEPLTALVSVAVGAGCGTAATLLVGKLTRTRGGTVQTEALTGRSGTLLLPAARGTSGQVRLTVGGSIVDLIATTDDDEPLAAREEVLVVEVRDGVAHVTRNPARSVSPKPTTPNKVTT